MKKVNKKAGIILSLALMGSVLCGSIGANAAFYAGTNSKNYDYKGKTGSISVMSDVIPTSTGTYYRYKGSIYYPSKTTVYTYVKGYYKSNGILASCSKDSLAYNSYSEVAYATVPDGGVGFCTPEKKCVSKGSIAGSQVGTVKYPN